MSLEENKAIAKRWNDEVWNKGNLAVIDELADDGYVNHANNDSDREAFRQFATAARAAFSGASMAMEDMLAEGDKVAVRWTIQGTHSGTLWGIPPTGKTGAMSGISIYCIRDGKIVEDWANSDMLGMLQQLGVVPAM